TGCRTEPCITLQLG
ncbi:transposase IS66 family protein, partial [Escherichia coli 8.2524]